MEPLRLLPWLHGSRRAKDALLTMRTENGPHPEHREAMRLEGWIGSQSVRHRNTRYLVSATVVSSQPLVVGVSNCCLQRSIIRADA
jgi:hypothetical protein